MKKRLIALAIGMCFVSAQAQESSTNVAMRQGGVDLTWARNITGSGVTIGVIDQGFDLSHGDFKGKILASKNFYSAGNVAWGSHGTAMASIAAGASNGSGTIGVAPNATLILAQAGPGGTVNSLADYAVANALTWMSTMRPAVINMSFGAEYSSTFQRTVTMSSKSGIYIANSRFGTNYGASDVILGDYARAAAAGSILVVSAGNQALPYATFPAMYASRTDANGRLELGGRMIVVGAVDSGNQIAAFSNRAGHLCQNYSGTQCKDQYLTRDFFVVAPGINLISAVPNQLGRGRDSAALTSGTSQAAAYVSGGMALIKQAWPQLRPEQLVNLVLTTTRDLGVRGTDDVYGRGLVDFNAATKPQGSLVVASRNLVITPSTRFYGSNSAFRAGAIAVSGFAESLRTSSVLKNTQILDSYGRNYSADFTKTVAVNAQFADPASPWLGYSGFAHTDFYLDDRRWITVFPGTYGSALQYNHVLGAATWNLQLGALQEKNGFLGNYGSGALSFGNSQSQWIMLGTELPITDNRSAFIQYGRGITHISPSEHSMFEFESALQTATWRMGLIQRGLWTETDRMQISIGTPVSIKRGRMRVTGVVGYDYENLGDDQYLAKPVTQTDIVDLRQHNDYNLAITYTNSITKNSKFAINAVHQYNTATGSANNFLGLNISWTQ
jgi:subtilisin family serine protease